MKRDMELIRLLLLQVEAGTPPAELSEYSKDEKVYHAVLLIERGLVDGGVLENHG